MTEKRNRLFKPDRLIWLLLLLLLLERLLLFIQLGPDYLSYSDVKPMSKQAYTLQKLVSFPCGARFPAL